MSDFAAVTNALADEGPASAAGDVEIAALDAACAALPGVDRDAVRNALMASQHVLDAAEEAEIDAMLAATGFAGMEVTDRGVRMHIRHCERFSRALTASFDAMVRARGGQNYVEWESTYTNPDDTTETRKYTVIITRGGGATPHQLRAFAEQQLAQNQARINAVVAVLERRPLLVDPREILHALGLADPCACPEEGGWGWDCPLHTPLEITDGEMRQLLAVVRPALGHVQGVWSRIFHSDPERTDYDGILANVLALLVARLRPGVGMPKNVPARS